MLDLTCFWGPHEPDHCSWHWRHPGRGSQPLPCTLQAVWSAAPPRPGAPSPEGAGSPLQPRRGCGSRGVGTCPVTCLAPGLLRSQIPGAPSALGSGPAVSSRRPGDPCAAETQALPSS